MTRRHDHDDPHDAHLLAALRHAPDRDALPPAKVSARILAAARAAVRSADATRPHWWQRLGAWLTQPQVAAAFGTLAVASLVGVMWSTREPPLPELTPTSPSADRADERSIAAAPATSMPAEAAAPQPQANGVAAAPAAGSEPRDKVAAAPRPRPVGKDSVVRPQQRSRAEVESAAAPEAAAPAAATPTAPPPAPFPAAAPPPAAAPAPQAADAAPPGAAAERRSANEGDLQGLARQQGAAASRAASAATLGMALAAKVRVADPLAAVDATLAAGARWQGAGLAGGRPHGDAQRAFWVSVKVATQGRWEAVSPQAPSAPWLVLEQGARNAILWTANDDALYITVQGQSWRAAVDAARVADWQAQVARW